MWSRVQHTVGRFWVSLQYREQISLVLCGTALAAFIGYVAIALPLLDYRDTTARQLANQEVRFQRIQSLLAQINPQTVDRAAKISGDVRANVLALAQEEDINVDRIQAGNETFTLFLTIAPEALFGWLARIESDLNVEPVSLTLRKIGQANSLSAQLSFKTGN